MWNDYIWEMYKQTSGNKVIEMFKNNLSGKIQKEYPDEIASLLESFVVSKWTREDIYIQLKDTIDIGEEEYDEEWVDFVPEEVSDTVDEWFMGWCKYVTETEDESNIDYKALFSVFSRNIAYWSTFLSVEPAEGFFVPYYFYSTYNVLEKIANTFDISLPVLPAKSDYKGRLWHYANICKSLYLFRLEKQFSMFELCAFLYDFAPKYIGGIDSYIIKDLPAPKSAYFIGGGGDNSDAAAEDDPECLSYWQCNPGTRAGDMIVMYLRQPISAISSVWRAYSVGFIDPFFWYYRMTYIGKPIKIDRVRINDIKKDKVLGNMPIVKKNMQGINGCELLPSEYNHIVDMSGKDIQKLEFIMDVGEEDYPNEKAVEEKLIKPLLKKLGYSADDYMQQMYIEIGNHNHALIPDFVINPLQKSGHQSGFAVIEAKRSIKKKNDLDDAKKQVRGYGKLLGAKYCAVASMEKIWVMAAEDDYTNDVFVSSWSELKDSDMMYKLKKFIGK